MEACAFFFFAFLFFSLPLPPANPHLPLSLTHTLLSSPPPLSLSP